MHSQKTAISCHTDSEEDLRHVGQVYVHEYGHYVISYARAQHGNHCNVLPCHGHGGLKLASHSLREK